MRKFILLFLILIFSATNISLTNYLGGNYCFAEEVEQTTPTTENSEIPTSPINNVESNPTKNDNDSVEEMKSKDNPINYDASSEKINDKKFQPQKHEADNNPPVLRPTRKQMRAQRKAEKARQKKELYDSLNNMFCPIEEFTEKKADTPKVYTQKDYEQAYRDMPIPSFSYVHGIDPMQYYDMMDSAWSPYPLLRLNSPLYFKNITIAPGYYLLTPRKYKDDWYILFKEAGSVKYILPVFEKGYTPEYYYKTHLKELDMKKSQRWTIKFLNSWGKYIRSSKRKPAIKCNLELTDLDNKFVLIELYYDAYKYSTVVRIERF